MKQIIVKTVAMIAAVCMAAPAVSATENKKDLETLEQKNISVKGFSGTFLQTKVLVNKKEIKSEGMLYFSNPDKMSMIYSNPEGDKFIINAGKMGITKGEKTNIFDLGKNKSMKSLAITLLYSMQGNIDDLAEACDADVDARKTSAGWKIELKARKKAPKGYATIELEYSPDGTIKSMRMTEFNGISTLYEMASLKKGPQTDEKVFEISK